MAPPMTPLEEPMLDLNKLLQVLWRRRGIIQKTTAACLVVAALYGFLWPKTYQTVTTVKVPDSSAQAGANALRDMAFLPTSGDPIETSMQIAMADKVAQGVIETLHLKDLPQFKNMDEPKLVWYLQHQVKVDNVKRSNLLSIAARAKTAQASADLANAWAQNFIQVNQDLYQASEEERYKFLHGQLNAIRTKLEEDRANKQNYLNESSEAEADQVIYKSLLEQAQESRIRSNNESTGIVVVDPAAVPDKAVSPKKSVSLILGLLAGIFLGVAAAFGRERLEDRTYETADLTQAVRAPLWGNLPLSHEAGPHPLLSNPSLSSEPDFLQSLKTLRANLLLARPDAGALTLGLFSPMRAEGRTLTTANLGICLAQAGKRVLLIDADLENPGLGKLFGLETSNLPGLSGLLASQGAKDAIKPSGIANLSLLPAPLGSKDLSGVLNPSALKKWVGEAKSKFDYLLFDGAPILLSPDSAVLCAGLDGALLLARWGVTGRQNFQEAAQKIQGAHGAIWGTVFNGVESDKGSWWDWNPLAKGSGRSTGSVKSRPADLRTDP